MRRTIKRTIQALSLIIITISLGAAFADLRGNFTVPQGGWSQPNKGLIEVVMVIGQSNADGRDNGALYAPAGNEGNVRFRMDQTGAVAGNTLAPQAYFGGTKYGPEMRLGTDFDTARPARPMAIYKYAVGGTALANYWHPYRSATGARHFAQAMNGLATYMQQLRGEGYDPELRMVLWVQGENDAASAAFAPLYQQHLEETIKYSRDVAGDPALLWAVYRLPSWQSYADLATVRAAQDAVTAADGDAFLIDSDAYADIGDGIHIDNAAQLSLGASAAAIYLARFP